MAFLIFSAFSFPNFTVNSWSHYGQTVDSLGKIVYTSFWERSQFEQQKIKIIDRLLDLQLFCLVFLQK